jgi:GNAT superfamily N-acetyltransferase
MFQHFEPQSVFERSRGDYLISTDRSKLQIEVVRGFLACSYWANNRPHETIDRSIANSIWFGIYRAGKVGDASDRAELSNTSQVGFARVITDCATFAYLCDVFIAEEARGAGLGKWMIETILAHPDLQGLRRWMLATADAHGLYRQFGFSEISAPERWMEIYSPQPE